MKLIEEHTCEPEKNKSKTRWKRNSLNRLVASRCSRLQLRRMERLKSSDYSATFNASLKVAPGDSQSSKLLHNKFKNKVKLWMDHSVFF